MNFDKIFKKLENKILSKSNLTLEDKLLLERIKAKDEKLIIEIFVNELNKIKSQLEKLEFRRFDKDFTEKDREKLEYLEKKKKNIVNLIKEYNASHVKLSIDSFKWDTILWEWNTILWELNENTLDTVDNILDLFDFIVDIREVFDD